MSRTLAIAAALPLAAILAMAASEADARCITAGAVTECKLAESAGKVGDKRLLKRFGRDDARPTFRVVVEWAPNDPGCLPGDSSCQGVERCNLYVEIHETDRSEPWVHFVALLVPGHNTSGGSSSMVIAKNQEALIVDEHANRFTPSSCWAGISMRYAERVERFFR